MKKHKHNNWQRSGLTRISPVLPFALMTFVLAVLRMDRRRFLAVSVLGMLPAAASFTAGAPRLGMLRRNPDTGTAGKVLLFAMVVISLYGQYHLFNCASQRALRRPVTSAR